MSTAVMVERIANASPHRKARIAGVFYLLTVLSGGCLSMGRSRSEQRERHERRSKNFHSSLLNSVSSAGLDLRGWC